MSLVQQTEANGVRVPCVAGGHGAGTQDITTCGAMAEQTLLVHGVVRRGAGFASRIGWQNPGERSLKLGTPRLYDGRPLAFKTRSQ